FLAAFVSLALVLGWARAAAEVDRGFRGRYLTLVVPALCCVYFIWELYYDGSALGRLAQMSLFLLTCLLFPFNTQYGYDYGYHHRAQLKGFEQDMAAGVPVSVLVDRYYDYVYLKTGEDDFARDMRLLRQAQVGPFVQLQEDDAYQAVYLPVVPVDRQGVSLE